MRYAALERDDSILSFAGFLSLLLHALFLLFFAFPKNEPVGVTEIIGTEITYQNFPQMQQFLNFSSTRKVYTTSASGLATPTSGSVFVEPARLKDQSATLTPAGQSIDAPDPVQDRINLGEATIEEAREVAPARTEQVGAAPQKKVKFSPLPEGPNALVSDYEPVTDDDYRPAGSGRGDGADPGASGRGGSLRAAASGSRPATGSPQPGNASYPAPSSVRPTNPGGPRTQEIRPVTSTISQGPDVGNNPREIPLPAGPHDESRGGPPGLLGQRRILYQPKPEYPEWAERDNVQATVKFHIAIAPDGHVSKASLAKSSNFRELDRLAEEKVRQWRFEPRLGRVEEYSATVYFQLKKRSEL